MIELQKLEANGPSAEDLSKEQEVQRRELETSMKQNGYWTGALSTVDLLGWDPARIAKRKERIELLTTSNVKATLQKYFPKDHYSIVRLAPETTPKATP